MILINIFTLSPPLDEILVLATPLPPVVQISMVLIKVADISNILFYAHIFCDRSASTARYLCSLGGNPRILIILITNIPPVVTAIDGADKGC